MKVKVFLSTSISSIGSDEEYADICEQVKRAVRIEYEALRPEDEIIIFSNYEENEVPFGVNLKLHQLELAFNKMKHCDVIFLLSEIDGIIKPGCMIELNAWLSAGGNQPIIMSKAILKKEKK